jgi:hypothetical protein
MAEGAWIFLSHSHHDYDKVALVRNYLEQQEHHPLMFFLKCLNDDQEVDGLIRREIAARSWFVFCDSANSRGSTWVNSELNIINGLSDKTYTVVNLDDETRDLESQLFAITHKASVYVCYSRFDLEAARAIQATLRDNDFGVFSDLDLLPGEDWSQRVDTEIVKAATQGAVLVLLSERSFTLAEQFFYRDLRQALSAISISGRQAHIIPIYLNGFGGVPGAPQELERIQGMDFSKGDFTTNMHALMKTLRSFDWRAE